MPISHATTPLSRLLSIAKTDKSENAIGVVYADTRKGFDDRADDGWYTLPQARAYLVVSANRLRDLVKQGIIRSFSPDYTSHILLFSRDDCRKLLADSARRAGMFTGCVNDVVPQAPNGKKSIRKSGKR